MPKSIPEQKTVATIAANDDIDIIGKTQGLSYKTGSRTLLDRIDLQVPQHSRTIIMGPNGAGKSLLLRLLHGLLMPTDGRIFWDGKPLDAASRRKQAMVFQRPVLLRRSVAANLRFVLKMRGRTSTRQIDDILEEVGLAGRAKQPARLLSGGEQQRLTLARALATKPRVLFLDEPTASLDPASTAAIESIVQSAAERGTKVLFVTHDIGQARRLADDIVFLSQGRLVEHTSAPHFFEQPSSQAAIDYLAGKLILH